MKYYLKEEFLHDNNAKNAGNKARNDVESIVKSQGFKALILSVDNWYEMSTAKAQIHKAKAFSHSLNQLNEGDELLIQFPMLHHSFFTTSLVKKARKRGVKIYFIIHDLDALRFMNGQAVPLKHRIRMKIQESGLLAAADGIIAHNPIMKSVLVDKGIAEDKIVSLGIFDYLIPNFQEKTGLSKNQPIIVAGNLAQEKAGYLYSLPAKPAYTFMVLASTRAELLRMRLTLAHSYLMSFLQPLRVVLGLSGMVIVLRHVVVFLESTFAITTLTKRHFTWHQASRLLFGNSQPCLTLYLRMAVGLQ